MQNTFSIWLETVWGYYQPKGAMFLRADTAKTMKSRAWSTEELQAGLEAILTDGAIELPDDLSQLKDHKLG